jgi:8-oxo-dGTP pyrophosphatase MutT (NUDIX family)
MTKRNNPDAVASGLIPTIRNAARALIVSNQKILLLKKDGGGLSERYALPGGGQEAGETLVQALNRECMEEIGTHVDIHDLVHVADFFKLRDTEPPTTRHLVEFLFKCTVPDTYSPQSGLHPDKHQVDVVWASVEELQRIPLFPQSLAGYIVGKNSASSPVYLGTLNPDAPG